MRRRLVLSYLFLVLAVLVVLEVPLGVLAASHDKATMAAQAEREATGLSILVAEDFEQHIASQVPTLASQYRLRTGGEVMVVQAPHRVLAAAGTDRDDDSAGLDGRMLARALHQDSPVMLLDEPNAHLDFPNQHRMMGLMRRFVKERGVTALITLHDPNLALHYSDDVVMLKDGIVVAAGPTEVLLDDVHLQEVFVAEIMLERTVSGTHVVVPRNSAGEY